MKYQYFQFDILKLKNSYFVTLCNVVTLLYSPVILQCNLLKLIIKGFICDHIFEETTMGFDKRIF